MSGKIRKSLGSRFFDTFNVILMIFVSAVTLYPLLNMLMISISARWAVDKGLVTVWPIGFNLFAYKQFFEGDILLGYYNSIKYAITGTILAVFMNSLMAYPLSIKTFLIRKQVLFFVSFTMYFGAGLIPWYMVLKTLGMIDNIWGIIVPSALGAFNIIIFRTFFMELPDSLKESAFIDGANHFVIFLRIIIPLSKPVFATIALWSIVGHWNSFFGPFIVLNDPRKFPLQLVIANIVQKGMLPLLKQGLAQESAKELNEIAENTLRAAAIMASTVPILCVYPFLQRYFVKGVMIGSIKG